MISKLFEIFREGARSIVRERLCNVGAAGMILGIKESGSHPSSYTDCSLVDGFCHKERVASQ